MREGMVVLCVGTQAATQRYYSVFEFSFLSIVFCAAAEIDLITQKWQRH